MQYRLADTLKELGDALAGDPARLDEALRALDEAVGLASPLSDRFPSTLHYAKYLPILRADRGSTRLEAGQLEPARDDLAFADARLAGRVREETDSAEPLREHGKVKAALARLADRGGLREQARALMLEACDLQQRALAIDPNSRVDRTLLERHRAAQKGLDAPK